MRKALILLLICLFISINPIKSNAQCNQISKIYEKYYGLAAGLELFESQIDKDNNTYTVCSYRGNGNVLDLGNGMVLPDYGNVVHLLLIKFNRNAKPLWYRLIKTDFINSFPAITIDSSGYVYITTGIATSLAIDTIRLNFKDLDGFVLKFSPDGKAMWGRGIVGKGLNGNDVWPHSVAITPKANLYVSGYFTGDSAKFDNIYLKKKSTHTATSNLFIAKYDSSGKVQWVRAEGCSDPSKQVIVDFTRVCTDEDENLYVAGKYEGRSTDIKLGKFILQKGIDSVVLFIAKYTKNGEAVWAKLIKTNQSIKPNDLVYNGKGSVYLSFEYVLESRIDSFRFSSLGRQNLGLIRMDTSGKILKTRFIGTINSGIQTDDLKIDKQGNLYFGGVALPEFKIDNFQHISDTVNGWFSFTVKTDPDFHAIWAYFYDEFSVYEENDCITVDDSGKVNLIVTTPNQFSGYDKFYFMQFRNNFSVFPNVMHGNKCYEDQKGDISLSMLEGKRPYTVQWQGGYGSDSILIGLNGGDYHVAVTDANGCVQNLDIKVEAPPELKIDATIKNDYRNRQEGKVTLKVNGGTPPYKFQWNDPLHQTTQNAVVLFAGTYTVTITDKNGCEYDTSFTVENITGIENKNAIQILSLFPNPLNGNDLTIQFAPCNNFLSIAIYNSLGIVVYQNMLICKADNSFILYLPEMERGIYHIKFITGNSVISKKLLIDN